jgi:Skp family chaperone for outer membrane proteins
VKTRYIVTLLFAATLVSACAPSSNIGLLNVGRITANWPRYQGYEQSLQSDVQAIQASKGSALDKQRNEAALQIKYGAVTAQLTQQIRDAAAQIATQRNLKLVLTQEGVGYGGVDITPDVEKVLNITETASPTP